MKTVKEQEAIVASIRPTEIISDEIEKCCVCCVRCVFADSALVILHTDTQQYTALTQQRNSRCVKSSAIYSLLHSIHSIHTDFEIHFSFFEKGKIKISEKVIRH
jgi:hypothetical protein